MRIERAAGGKERGSVLLHVMLTGIVVALIAATLLRMSVLRYAMAARSARILQDKRDNYSILAAILATWNNANAGQGQVCAPITTALGVAYSGGGTPGVCGCSYSPVAQTVPPTLPYFSSALTPDGTCLLSIVSADRQ